VQEFEVTAEILEGLYGNSTPIDCERKITNEMVIRTSPTHRNTKNNTFAYFFSSFWRINFHSFFYSLFRLLTNFSLTG
jgi:hypothetical protein